MQDALYEDRRVLSNLIQKLEDQGYTIPDASSISSAAKRVATSNSKGQTMANNAVSNRTTISSVANNGGFSISDTVKNALQAGGYVGIETGNTVYPPREAVYAPRQDLYIKGDDKITSFGTGTYTDKNGNTQSVEGIYEGTWGKETMVSDDNKIYRQFITTDGNEYFLNQSDSELTAWHESPTFEEELMKYKTAYEEWKSLPADERPDVWYELYEYDSGYDPAIYNEMILTNFDSTKMTRWFLANPKMIAWKQQHENY